MLKSSAHYDQLRAKRRELVPVMAIWCIPFCFRYWFYFISAASSQLEVNLIESAMEKCEWKTTAVVGKSEWGTLVSGGREWADQLPFTSTFSVRPLHCSTPCRSCEGADFSTSFLPPQRRQITSTKTSRHNLSLAHIGSCCLLHALHICRGHTAAIKVFSLFRSVGMANRTKERDKGFVFPHSMTEWGSRWSIPQCTGTSLFNMWLLCDLTVAPGSRKICWVKRQMVIYQIWLGTLADCIWWPRHR